MSSRWMGVLATSCLLATQGACGAQYTILNPSSLEISGNARISAQTMLPDAARYPAVVQKLALAEQVYETQLYLLKERRNKVRSRRRALGAASYGTLALSSAGAVLAAEYPGMDPDARLHQAGTAALSGLLIGGVLQLASYMQEDVDSVDVKISQLDGLHNQMLDGLRALADRAAPVAPPVVAGSAVPEPALPARDLEFEMSRTIQDFMNRAQQINVKG